MHLHSRALGYAIGLEAVLAGLAMFGGPHGTLEAWPWTLQLPGILLILFGSGETHFVWRVGGMLLIQCVLWYGVFAISGHVRQVRLRARRGAG